MKDHTMPVTLTVNGEAYTRDVEPRLTLVDFLLDGRPVRACLVFAVQAEGRSVTTVEGLAPKDGGLSVLQDAFWETHALQCGFCTPGMLIAAQSLLAEKLDPTIEDIHEAIGGNLCRCTGYQQIVEAIELAAR